MGPHSPVFCSELRTLAACTTFRASVGDPPRATFRADVLIGPLCGVVYTRRGPPRDTFRTLRSLLGDPFRAVR